MKAAVFLERDGILNAYGVEQGSRVAPLRVEQFRVLESVRPGLQELKKAGLLLLVATHQPAVGAGRMSRGEVDLMHAILRRKLPVDDVLLCASDDSTHPCYKPHPGLFLEAAFRWSLDLDRCYVISDKWPDAKAAQVAGCTSVLIDSPWVGTDHRDFIVPDFETAVRKVLQLHQAPVAFAASA